MDRLFARTLALTSVVGVCLALAAATSLAAIAYPSAYDQYLLELINRARADPAAEAALYGIALNEGLAPGTISSDAKQPLALNLNLVASAQAHSQWMLDTDTFSHTGQGGSSSHERMQDAGYTFTLPWGSGENIAWLGESPTVPQLTPSTAELHADLFVDDGIDGRGHRVNILDAAMKEIGTGVLDGEFSGYNAVMVTEDFAYSAGNSFLTGVIYNDLLVYDNDFYTPGEGVGGVLITATRLSDSAEFTTTAWASGGYSLQLAAGDYDVTLSGGGLSGTVAYSDVTIASQNVKLDYAGDAAVVAAVEPQSGPAYSQGLITGTGFGATAGSVQYTPTGEAAVDCEVLNWSATEIAFHIPAGVAAGSGHLAVVPDGAAESNPVAFEVTAPTTLHVDGDNATGKENGTEQYPFTTIQEAANAVAAGGTVKVASGSYAGSLTIDGKQVEIHGGYVGGTYPGTGDFGTGTRDTDPSTNNTVLDGGGAPAAVVCQGTGARGSLLASFKIRNGGATFNGGLVLRRVIAEH